MHSPGRAGARIISEQAESPGRATPSSSESSLECTAAGAQSQEKADMQHRPEASRGMILVIDSAANRRRGNGIRDPVPDESRPVL